MYALEEHTKIYVTEITETLSNVFGQTFLGHEPKDFFGTRTEMFVEGEFRFVSQKCPKNVQNI